MKRRLFNIRNYSDKKKLYIAAILMVVFSIGIGYAYLSSNLEMRGRIAVRAIEDIRVKDYKLNSTANGAQHISSEYGKSSVMTNFTLPNLNSTVTYDITTINRGNVVMMVKSITESLNNPNITFEISNLTLNSTLLPGDRQTYTFQVTFKYKSTVKTLPAVTEFNSKLDLVFDKKVSTLVAYNTGNVFRKTMDKSLVESIEFLNTIEVPNDALDSWDASASLDGSVIAWTKTGDNEGLVKLYIGGINGVTAPSNSSSLFRFSNLESIEFNNCFDTSKVGTFFRRFMDLENWRN